MRWCRPLSTASPPSSASPTRSKSAAPAPTFLDDRAVDAVMDKLFKNYKTWCKFLGRKHSLRLLQGQAEMQRRKILYMGLYLLIWGEAAKIRFMPECLCYIFHNMACELHGLLARNVSIVTGENIKPSYGGDDQAFRRKVVTPLYRVIEKEANKNKNGKTTHSNWCNYDDPNEYFWSANCFPWDGPCVMMVISLSRFVKLVQFLSQENYPTPSLPRALGNHTL